MNAVVTISIAIGTVLASGAVNLVILGVYVGRYRTMVEEIRDSAEESRKSLVLVREDVARIKGRLNFKAWTKEV